MRVSAPDSDAELSAKATLCATFDQMAGVDITTQEQRMLTVKQSVAILIAEMRRQSGNVKRIPKQKTIDLLATMLLRCCCR